ncbi:MAG: carboxylesterase/lipase family protein [Promethearchaeota archaeon]
MDKTKIIETKSGKIQGYVQGGLQIFKAIPFAEPPIGSLRFSPPVRKKPWEGVLETMKYGPYAFQGYSPLEEMFPQDIQESEDCLTLNVWTPATDSSKRPVMVWIHGGAFVTGSGAVPIYDGSTLATRGNVVVVTINYRLGAFGFLYIPGVTANVGIQDQIIALKWVQENIEKFGGDPENITILGESAGGCSVITLMASPAATGFFHKVIAQSAPVLQPNPTDKSTKDLLKKLNLKYGDIESLRALKAEDIIDAQDKILAEAEEAQESEIMGFRPSIDGEDGILPVHPLEAIKKGQSKSVDLLIGCTLEEGILFTFMDPRLKKLDSDSLESAVSNMLKSLNLEKKGKKIIEAYRNARKDHLSIEHIDILNAIWTDYVFRISDIHIAEAQHDHNPNVYFYIFTWPSPMMKGACHAIELPFVFGTLHQPGIDLFFGKGPEAELLCEKTMDTWIAFAHTGNPNNKDLPEWPSYDKTKRATMMMGKEFKVVNAPFEKERSAWDGIYKY